MRRTALLLAPIVCFAALLFADEKNNPKNNAGEMTGWICNAKCVDHSSAKAACHEVLSNRGGY